MFEPASALRLRAASALRRVQLSFLRSFLLAEIFDQNFQENVMENMNKIPHQNCLEKYSYFFAISYQKRIFQSTMASVGRWHFAW